MKNSHILPAFLKKEYIKHSKKFFLVDAKTRKSRIEQDLPKEDYILCQSCEGRISAVESYTSKHLSNSYEYMNRKAYPKFSLLDFEYQLLNNCDPKIFTLFVYSLLWRMHISNLPLYKSFKLPDDCAKDLRETLDLYLIGKESGLTKSVELLSSQRYAFIFMKPDHRSKGNSLVNYIEPVDNMGVIFSFLFRYYVIFLINTEKVPSYLLNFINQDFNTSKIMIVNTKLWDEITKTSAEALMGRYTRSL